jgi:hypothetical protein
MKNSFLSGEELTGMLKEKGRPCISVIVPTHRLSPERRAGALEVERAIAKAGEYLNERYGKEQVRSLLPMLDELYARIDFNHNADGIGLFVSGNVQQLVSFCFPVKEKILVGDSFEIRDIVYQLQYAQPYYVMHLTEKEAQLYQGAFNTLTPVKDTHFPLQHNETYEYNKPSRGSSYVGYAFTKEFERDKSQLEEIRFKDFIQDVNNLLDNYLDPSSLLVIAGTKKDVASFKNLQRHHDIAGEIPGNYVHTPLNELAALSWDAIKLFVNRKKQGLVREFEEKIGEGQGITGMKEIWEAANEGRGLRLLVEKDFSLPGILNKGDEYSMPLPQSVAHYTPADVVDTLIQIVLEKKGEVILVENNALANYQHIGLVTRY